MVDGQNPALLGGARNYFEIMGPKPSFRAPMVVQDFFHRQHVGTNYNVLYWHGIMYHGILCFF